MSRYRGFTPSRGVSVLLLPRGVVGRGRGDGVPHCFRQGLTGGTRPPLFWTEIRAKVSPLLQLVTY